jgi:hypothetical protein
VMLRSRAAGDPDLEADFVRDTQPYIPNVRFRSKEDIRQKRLWGLLTDLRWDFEGNALLTLGCY